ncbi:uncharacterized protein F4812DRAFT_465573 [Daldinia caldariorum]|uniref:uncharacterized protein n=1 Tax=Daldinia caldariorum TaxID=326644 RepID=UPI002008192C|nr:uncharacterized protein F4812DRAFT_465573 [Daldinia caldariorum]KAI1466927.1 hypothetical protein F4812DRAFT_465573 [Daldinia caldariorum]
MSIQLVTVEGSTLQTLEYETGSVRWIVDLDNHEILLLIGAIGELVIEGSIVGRGYIDSLENTAAKFTQPPIWLRQLRDPEYFKLRGQRIELSDVEHHILLALPSARDVVAEIVTFPDSSRPPVLVAFIHARNDDMAKCGDLSTRLVGEPSDSFRSRISVVQSQLQHLLLSYMVPLVFLPLASLLLTSTYKINRKLLREYATTLSKEELEQYQQTTTARRIPFIDTEKLLHQYFSGALHLELDQAVWTAVAAVHPILRTRVVLSPSHGLLQAMTLEGIEWTVLNNTEAQDFTVGAGKPLVQLRLRSAQDNQDPSYLFLNIHHDIYDGWTLPLIFKEVDAAYHGGNPFATPYHPVYPLPTTSFRCYALLGCFNGRLSDSSISYRA